jgi:uncharacterized protein
MAHMASINCPRTGQPMTKIRLGGVTVDYSKSSGGVFFDRFELQNFEGPQDTDGRALVEILDHYANPAINATGRIRCPRHPDVTMMRRFYNVMRRVEIDECPACGGIWLDSGELDLVRRSKTEATAELISAAVNRSIAQAYVADAGSGSKLNPMHSKLVNHRRPALTAAMIAVVLSFSVSPELQSRVIIFAISAIIMLWLPCFFVWDVPRRFHMQPAPVQYVYVFGWAGMAVAYGIIACAFIGKLSG